MNEEKILENMGDISPEFVKEARGRAKKRRPTLAVAAPIAAAVLVLIGAGILLGKLLPMASKGAEAPRGPETHQNDKDLTPEYGLIMEGKIVLLDPAKRRESVQNVTTIEGFTKRLNSELMSSSEGNVVWSPASVYIALGMLGETAKGDSLEELLAALGSESLAAVRNNVISLLLSESVNEENTHVELASSLWLNNKYSYDPEILGRLSEDYAASFYRGDPSDAGFADMLRSWLNKATDGLLGRSVENVKLAPDTVVSLISAICYRSPWRAPYSEQRTEQDVFHAEDGEITCDFLHRYEAVHEVYEGAGFVAVCEETEDGSVWYMLPDEGVSIEDMLDGGGYDFMFSKKNECESVCVNLTVPKLDVCADTDLIPTLKTMGVRTCFDPINADFTALVGEGLFVSSAVHSARIVTDEKGVLAAAYTKIDAAPGSASAPDPPERIIDIILDRPFVMFVTGTSGQPLFIGVIRTPSN